MRNLGATFGRQKVKRSWRRRYAASPDYGLISHYREKQEKEIVFAES
jgi:hypothetical protein